MQTIMPAMNEADKRRAPSFVNSNVIASGTAMQIRTFSA